jgi:hypothetical protein
VSLDLSVISDNRITSEQMKAVNDFLLANKFSRDEYGYSSDDVDLSIHIYLETEPEKDEFWSDGPPSVVWFMPLTEIAFESMHNRESHEKSYRMAKESARLLHGFIYDNQVGTVYDSEGNSCDHFKTGKACEQYGAGMELFMRCVGTFQDILVTKK